MRRVASADQVTPLVRPGTKGNNTYSRSLRAGHSPISAPRSRASFSSLGGAPIEAARDEDNKFDFKGIFILCVNTMNGPGLLALPKAFAECGLVAGVVAMLCCAWITSATSHVLADAVLATKRKTQDYQAVYEFTDLARIHFGPTMETVTVLMLCLTLGALAIAQITIVAQALDALIITLIGKSHALRYYPRMEMVSSDSMSLQPFGVNQMMVSLGFVVAMVICIILGMMDLTANKLPQYISFGLLLLSAVTLFAHITPMAKQQMYQMNNTTGLASYFGDDPTSIVGVAVFNFSIVIAIPSLIADSRQGADLAGAVSLSLAAIVLLYVSVGWVGASGYGMGSDNLMAPMLEGPQTTILAKVACFSFVWALVPPLPIYTILISRNLEQVMGRPSLAKILGVFVPWTLSMFLYMSEAFGAFVVWTSILVLGFTNYTLPLAIAARACGGLPSRKENGRRGCFQEMWDGILSAWSDEVGRKALVINFIITAVLVVVVVMNVQKALRAPSIEAAIDEAL